MTYRLGGHAFLGWRQNLIQPAVGALAVAVEGYAGAVGGDLEAGVRAFAAIRPLGLQFGIAAGARNAWPPAFAVTYEDPVVRGGLLRRGGALRVEWMPASGHGAVGIMAPLAQSWVGRTRPRRIAVPVPHHPPIARPAPPSDPAIAALLDSLRESAEWIDELTTPFVDAQLETNDEWLRTIEDAMEKMRRGRTYPSEVTSYHRGVRRLFGLALGADGPLADSVTDAARRIVLDEVLLPANRHFGTVRHPSYFASLRLRALGRFGDWLDGARSPVPPRR